MIRSMTGYGAAQRETDGVRYALELKSVNHRYLKLLIRLPEPLQFAESVVEKLLRSRIARGSVSYVLRVQCEGEVGQATLSEATMQRYVDQLAKVRLPAGTTSTIDLGAVAALPGVCLVPDAEEETRKRYLDAVEDVTTRAVDGLQQMRREEGEALHSDLLQACDALRAYVADVTARAPVVVEEYHKRLRARVETLLQAGKLELESEGLMREVAIYADRCDISEEVTRLRSHIDQFVEICNRDGQVGRTLDFLTQELLREANTIASKSADTAISRHVVEIKRLIDRLREQVQNVE